MTLITRHDLVPIREAISPGQRQALTGLYDAVAHEMNQIAGEAESVMVRRRVLLDDAVRVHQRLWPKRHWQGRRRPPPDAPPLPPLRNGARIIGGRALRQLCRTILRRHGPQTLVELHSYIHLYGCKLDAHDPVKGLADAMGYEVEIGAAYRIKRGVYAATERVDPTGRLSRQPPQPQPLQPHPPAPLNTANNSFHSALFKNDPSV